MKEAKPTNCDTRMFVPKKYRLSVRSPSIKPRPRPYHVMYIRQISPRNFLCFLE